jgi:hypothetical protein
LAVNVVIAVYVFITEHWRMLLVTTVGVVLLVAVGMLMYKVMLQRRCVKVNKTVEQCVYTYVRASKDTDVVNQYSVIEAGCINIRKGTIDESKKMPIS